MSKIMMFLLFISLVGCSAATPKFSLDAGLPGCVNVKVEKLSVTGVFEAQNVNYHRINEQCKDLPYHKGDN